MIQQAQGYLDPLVRNHLYALETSSRLTVLFRKVRQPLAVNATPERVIEVLCEAGINCVLMGTHALNTWRSEPRATQDTDVLVPKRDLRKAIRALREAFPELTVTDLPVVTRFLEPTMGKPVIDVMKPTQVVFQVVFRHAIKIGDTHRIPDLEMALASKFAAMVSPNRDPAKKMIDGGDFIDVVKNNRAVINVAKLQRLAEKVYPGGAKEIIQMLEDIDAGRTIQL